MDPMTLTNVALTTALAAAMEAVKEARGSKTLKATRRNVLKSLKAEAARRVRIGAF